MHNSSPSPPATPPTAPAQPLRVLLIEDSELDADLLVRELKRAGYAPNWRRVACAADLQAALADEPWDLVLSDYMMPGFGGLEALQAIQASGQDLPFILISGTIGEETAVEAMRAGAHDYLLKDQLTRLGAAIARELREAESRRKRREAEAAAQAAQQETMRLLAVAEQSRIALLNVVEDQKRIEARLRVRTTALEAAANAIVMTDRDGTIQWTNPAWTTVTGYTAAESLGQNPRLLKSGVHDAAYYANLWKTILAGKVWQGEVTNRRKDGTHYIEETTITPVTDADGRITHFIGIKQDITERKRAQQAVEESHERYRRAIIAANAVPYQKDYATDTYVFMGERIKDITGYAPQELRSTVWKQMVLETVLYSEAAHLPLPEVTRRVIAGQIKEWQVDHRIRTRSGAERWISDSSISLYDQAGKYTGSLGIIQDITERKRAESALRDSETRFRQVTEHLGEWIWEVDANGLYTYASPIVEKMLGYRPDELVGKLHFFDLFPPDLRETMKRDALEHFNSRQPFVRFKNHCVHRDGRRVLVETSGTPLLDATGRLLGFRGVDMDITEREQAEEQIRSQAQMLDLAQDAIAIRSLDGVVRYWNKGYERLTGWTAAEAVGRSIVELIGMDRPHYEQTNQTVLTQGQWSGERVVRAKDGRRLTLMSRLTLVRDEQGQPKEVFAINTDITEQKKLEAQFLRAQRMESVGRLAGGIAHDLNNILAPILMATDLLREEAPSPEARVMIDTLQGSAQRGAEVVKQLLTYARGTEGQRIPVPPGHLIKEMAKIIRETFPKSITVRTELPKDLWPIMGDPTQLHQVLLNLCVNARDAMPEGGTLTLTVQNVTLTEANLRGRPEVKPGPFVVLWVSDTGTGMPPEVLENIFDPFFTTKELDKGTGLGLATVLGIVKSHEGFIQVESVVGHGSHFAVHLPAVPAAAPSSRETNLMPPPKGQGEWILVVDDETGIRDITRRILERHGYRVLLAEDGKQALELHAQHRADIQLVITDLMMPVMGGAAAIHALRERDARLKIIAISGMASSTRRADLESLRVLAFLPKPCPPELLLETVQAALRGRNPPSRLDD